MMIDLQQVFFWYSIGGLAMFVLLLPMQFNRPFKKPVTCFTMSVLFNPIFLPFAIACLFYYLLKGIAENIKPIKYQKTKLNRKNRRALNSANKRRF